MRKFVTIFCFFLTTPLLASHIVGGEIELLHLNGFTYQVNLIYYFDAGRNPARRPELEEPTIDLFIYRKFDDAQIRRLTLQYISKTRVPYTQPDCSAGEIVSDKLIYSATIELTPDLYSDPGGYYMIWARCCRNYSILNIFSQDPTRGGIAAGQTFYLEFPSVMQRGKQFINSSPRSFPALNDYACPNKPYFVDFAGIDDDGDSLVYSLATPLSTVTVNAVPPATPRPYPDVRWIPGFGPDRMINGSPISTEFPDLKISREGLLRVTPRSQGLYVFGVRIEEYRNNNKIGETRRDFQMLVTDCRISVPPVITGKAPGSSTFVGGNLSVSYSNGVSDEDRCLVVNVTDEDANRADDNFQEFIRLRVVPLNFRNRDLSDLLPAESTGIISGNGSLQFDICLPKCPYFLGGPYQIGVVAYDDACAVPLTDTLKIEVNVEPPPNERARFTPPDKVNAILNEGEKASWNFEAKDADGDELLFFALTDGFAMDVSGMKTAVTTNVPGLLKGTLNWDAYCDIYDFTKRTSFNLRLLVDDVDECDLNDPDTLTYKLDVILPPNGEPLIDTDLTTNPAEIEVAGLERKIFENLSFVVTGKDVIDNAPITIKMVGDGFRGSDYGMNFQKSTAIGTVSAPFSWDLVCDKFDLSQKDEFNIGFIAIDSINKCRVRKVDSLTVKVKVLKPDNAPPQLTIVNNSAVASYSNGQAVVAPGQELLLQLNVSDTDNAPKDKLSLSLLEVEGEEPEGIWTFQNVTGQSVLSSTLQWAPLCSIFKDDVYEQDYRFSFRFTDDRCLTAVADTVVIDVKVKDIESEGFDVLPANVFTPNGDGYNDYYSMERRDGSGELINILPPDNCRGVFENIRIYNRWGRLVFFSSERDFRWLGLDEAAGVYFYHITFSNREFKGTVSLRD